MNNLKLEQYWNDIPIGKENAIDYPALMEKWRKTEREVRKTLHNLSLFDNGDDFILVRSAGGKGFYRTDEAKTIQAYKTECLNKGKSVFAPVKKINRVLGADTQQINLINNMRVIREGKGLKQSEVCERMPEKAMDKAMLSKMENNICLPTPAQLNKLAEIYGCNSTDLINFDYFNKEVELL